MSRNQIGHNNPNWGNKVSCDIVIPTFNNDQVLMGCLVNLLTFTTANMKVFVINNGESYPERIAISPLLSYHRMDKNLGWMGGINAGAKMGTGKYILMLNDDTQVLPNDRGWLAKMVRYLEEHPDTAAVVPMSNLVMGYQHFANYNMPPAVSVSYVSNFCTLIRRDVFEKIGGLDEALPGGDDIDMSIRVKDLGLKLVIMRDVFMYHHGFVTGNRLFGADWNSADYADRLKIALIKKHGFKKWLDTVLDRAYKVEIGELKEDMETKEIRINIDPTKSILDVGCGNRKIYPSAIGVDLTPKGEMGVAGSQLSGNPSEADIVSDYTDMPMIKDESYDYVVSRHTLEHAIDLVRTLTEWKRVLKIGGRLVISVPDDDVLPGVPLDPTHVHAFTKKSLEQILTILGFKIISNVTPQSCYSFVCVAEKGVA